LSWDIIYVPFKKNSPVEVPQKQDFCHFVSEGQGLGQSGLNS